MLELKKIAITGGLSSGKTTVCQILEEHGAYLVNADEITHRLLSLDSDCIKRVADLLGSDIFSHDTIDRRKISQIVFSDPHKLAALEDILHPIILSEIEKEFQNLRDKEHFTMFVAEVPLLYEAGWETHFDLVISVISDIKIAEQRTLSDDFNKRAKRQFTNDEKCKLADFTINNNGSLLELRKQVDQILPHLT